MSLSIVGSGQSMHDGHAMTQPCYAHFLDVWGEMDGLMLKKQVCMAAFIFECIGTHFFF